MDEKKKRNGLRDFLEKQQQKIKNKQFTCPLCKETFKGLNALGAHMKVHCT